MTMPMEPGEETPDRPDRINHRPWHDWRWIAAVSAFIGVLGIAAFAVSAVNTGEGVDKSNEILHEFQPVVAGLQKLAEQNADNIATLEQNQSSLDVLVSFVNDLQANQANQPASPSGQDFINILCASTDPVRLNACAEFQEGHPSP